MRQIVFIVALLLTTSLTALAVDVAPRISDREIIEGLAEIKTLRAEVNALRVEMNARFDAQQKEMNARFDAQQKQIDYIGSLMVAMLVSMFTLFGGLIGFIVWDRRTVLHPMEKRVEAVERETHRRLEEHSVGIADSQQLLKALRDLAKRDGSLAEVLRGFNLL